MTARQPEQEKHTLQAAVQELADIMAALRDPQTGCPWDVEQTHASIAPYALEEAYEVVDAIENGDPTTLCDELGDLLLQVVFHAQMAREAGIFTLTDVAASISRKMVRRHPHVFSGDDRITSAADQTRSWEDIKAAERDEKTSAPTSSLDGIARALPALMRAEKLQKRAARASFDWPDAQGARGKILEELDEISQAQSEGDETALLDEAGDLLFSCVNYLRKLGINSEDALRAANAKFERRFRAMETQVIAEHASLTSVPLDQLEKAWQDVKAQES